LSQARFDFVESQRNLAKVEIGLGYKYSILIFIYSILIADLNAGGLCALFM